ncbi:MAG TPA: hypothetical protein PL190_07705 [Caldisericia bacterium]|nr:MAG: hypothetical protein BWX90_01391 [bacterium ADurb.Bin132]HNW31387.1 hypothetical protein [Caldisericia bacterium]HNY61947.1 hypothetical protein [Caldisericia bacterium]HOC80212.1 hypothetical protein [Caldisericia bacterium]HOG71014.1 hypothetical protein [Caldisericia bacterium]
MNNQHLELFAKLDGNFHDSFTEALSATLNASKINIKTGFLAGLTGTAFAPACDTEEDCTAWWMESAHIDHRLDFIKDTIGFNLKTLKLGKGIWPIPENLPEEALLHLSSGGMVLLKSWPIWQVAANANGKTERIVFEGFEKLDWCENCFTNCFLVTGKAKSFNEKQATLEAIKHGAKLATGDFSIDKTCWGTTLYDKAIEKLEEEYFCPSCKEESIGCAYRTFRRIEGTIFYGKSFTSEVKNLGIVENQISNELVNTLETMSKVTEKLTSKGFRERYASGSFASDSKISLLELKKGQEKIGELWTKATLSI